MPALSRLTLLLALLALCPAGGPRLAAAPAAWLKVETRDFVIYSDAPERAVVECAVNYAAFRRAFGELFLAPGQTLPPSTFVLFRQEKGFRDVVPRDTQAGNDMKTVNFSCEVDESPLSTFALAGDRDHALELTFEFETIWALRRLGHAVPLWMSQGAGSVLSTVTLRKGQCLLGDEGRRRFTDRLEWPRFFEVGETTKFYREATSELGDYLAQAWGLMHWVLLSEGDPRARFDAIEQALRTRPALEVVPEITHTPLPQLSKTLYRHPKRGRTLPFDEAAVRASLRIAPAPEAEVLAQTSNLLFAAQRTAEGIARLDRAAALAPELPAVQEALARRCLREGSQREAIDHYRRAIAAGSTNFTAYLLSATQRLDDNRTFGSDQAGEGGPEALVALGELRRALAIYPGSVRCTQALGRALYVAPQADPAGLDELSRGVGDGDAAQVVRLYRALLHSRLGDRASCARDFREILADGSVSPKLRAAVERQYLQETVASDASRIDKLARAQDYAAAYALLAAVEQDDDPLLRQNYQRLREWLKKAVARDSSATPAERKLAGLE